MGLGQSRRKPGRNRARHRWLAGSISPPFSALDRGLPSALSANGNYLEDMLPAFRFTGRARASGAWFGVVSRVWI